MKIRSPIVSVLGHVDHGKTTLLDYIRGSTIADKEAGGITQHIGATEIPNDTIEEICGNFISRLTIKDLIPGLFFIDTPGHVDFSYEVSRSLAACDGALLIVLDTPNTADLNKIYNDFVKFVENQNFEYLDYIKAFENKIQKYYGDKEVKIVVV